jgi:8-oxo-dGTP pyrophosphatase MutT (NUDIX family)
LLVDEENRVLLLKTHFDPEVGLPPRWLTPGGGIDHGETTLQAAVRELLEETGLVIDPAILEEPVLETSGRWDWADGLSYHTYKDTIYELRVLNFDPDTSGFTQDEHRDVLEYRWWTIAELMESDEALAPHDLKDWLASRFSS